MAIDTAAPLNGFGIDPSPDQLEVLDEIQHRVLWLAARMVDSANHDRPSSDGIKVGGHQASSASLVTAMTALWFAHLDEPDLVSVKPHASPAFHAIQYLLGFLDPRYLTTLRAKGGLQAYPSRTKDPDRVDFSTGSVGLGAAAPLFAAATRRYVDSHFDARPASRFIALLGDAELDEGNIWEAISDPATEGLGNVMWVVDFNRQSLDRVIPGIRIGQWTKQFEAAGWHVVIVKYGVALTAAFGLPGGHHLQAWLDSMPNEQYQSLFALAPAEVRERFLDGALPGVAEFCQSYDDESLRALVTDLGGHDLASMLAAYQACDAQTDRPSVVFAYTIKGWSLPLAGNPRNHSALMSTEQIDAMRAGLGLSKHTEWDRFPAGSAAGKLADERGRHLTRRPRRPQSRIEVPSQTGLRPTKPVATQEAFGRVLVDLSRDEQLRTLMVSTAPDVATSTNLAGFLNRTGVFRPTEQRNWSGTSALRWEEGPQGQHIELGISEMNLFLLLGQLGLSWDLSDQPLVAVGTVYDPFVLRGLDAFIYSVYSGARFIVAGTPSGVTLAPEGGAHQSTMTPSVGLELPGCTLIEPAYAGALDWLVCDAMSHIVAAPAGGAGHEDGAYYFRLSTRPIDQSPFDEAMTRLGEALLRRHVLAGAYRLVDASGLSSTGAPTVNLAGSGAILPELLAAAKILADEGIAAHVVDVTSLDRLYRSWRLATAVAVHEAKVPSIPGTLRSTFAAGAPLVTVHDASSHAMAWLGAALGVPTISLGVDSFGQSGSLADLYEIHGLVPEVIVNSALAALSLR